MFVKYQHVERFGNTEVEGIELGKCYIFPKIDGTNGSVWSEHGVAHCGSRRRELSIESDNAGFFKEVCNNIDICLFVTNNPNLRLYGEWLVPHSLKTYREDSWRKFYVFDVCEYSEENGLRYLPYEEYKVLLDEYFINYIPPLRIINNPDYEKLVSFLEVNDYLIEDGKGKGEGIVIKNYDYVNKFGRTTWAKIVTSDFKEKHSRIMGAPEQNGKSMVEVEIAEEYTTSAIVDKVYANIMNTSGWSGKSIPRLLETVYHDVVVEECWAFLKKHKYPTINFKTLRSCVYNKVKQLKPEVF